MNRTSDERQRIVPGIMVNQYPLTSVLSAVHWKLMVEQGL